MNFLKFLPNVFMTCGIKRRKSMRKILFRGKQKNTNDWLYGSLLCFHGYSIYDLSLGHWEGVQGKTVGQYTGLTDKNGKKIFEGDILKYTRTKWHEPLHADNGEDLISLHLVYFDEIQAAFKQSHYTGKDKKLIGSGFLVFDDPRADKNIIEIIGNIYDNPELLKGE